MSSSATIRGLKEDALKLIEKGKNTPNPSLPSSSNYPPGTHISQASPQLNKTPAGYPKVKLGARLGPAKHGKSPANNAKPPKPNVINLFQEKLVDKLGDPQVQAEGKEVIQKQAVRKIHKMMK